MKVLNLSTGLILAIDSAVNFLAKEIVDTLKSYKNLKSFELKGNTLGIKAAEAVGDALKLHPTFEVTCLFMVIKEMMLHLFLSKVIFIIYTHDGRFQISHLGKWKDFVLCCIE